jgi:hypothetical protein
MGLTLNRVVGGVSGEDEDQITRITITSGACSLWGLASLPEDFKHFLVPGMVANLSTGVDRAADRLVSRRGRCSGGITHKGGVALMVIHSGVASYLKS